ncbi:unnamed protein product [Medioppia subpectinata]|uniref:Uncharacterized protein n=1 Tax=Medioppia subpectinata TaxID=1979941 RepID=A0A7R9L279_9ACAR|nr:unnamed protein product [Medioppia subpectinata]CAG2112957.1 unnamed protein product [Medioppia subpectinata]
MAKFCHKTRSAAILIPIAYGKTALKYIKGDANMVSFASDLKVTIFGRTEDRKLLDIEVEGKRGFAPISHIREELILIKDPNIVVKINDTVKTNESNKGLNNENADLEEKKSAIDLSTQSSPIYSSLSEESFESQTKTPTQDKYTVIDGTSFIAEDMDMYLVTSPVIQTQPMTATKSATIELNLDNITEVKPNNDFNSNTDNQLVTNQSDNTLESMDKLNPSTISAPNEDKSIIENETKDVTNERQNNDIADDVEVVDNSSEVKSVDNVIENDNKSILQDIQPILNDSSKPNADSSNIPHDSNDNKLSETDISDESSNTNNTAIKVDLKPNDTLDTGNKPLENMTENLRIDTNLEEPKENLKESFVDSEKTEKEQMTS